MEVGARLAERACFFLVHHEVCAEIVSDLVHLVAVVFILLLIIVQEVFALVGGVPALDASAGAAASAPGRISWCWRRFLVVIARGVGIAPPLLH